jgi:hypothetical protein
MRRRLVTSLHPFRFTLIGLLTLAFAAGSIPTPVWAGDVTSGSLASGVWMTTAEAGGEITYAPAERLSLRCPGTPDPVPLHGHVHIVTRHRDRDDSTDALVANAGPVIDVYANLANVVGTGTTTGDLYVGAGAIKMSFIPPPDSDRTLRFVALFELIPSNACPSITLDASVTLVFDATWALDANLSTVTFGSHQ